MMMTKRTISYFITLSVFSTICIANANDEDFRSTSDFRTDWREEATQWTSELRSESLRSLSQDMISNLDSEQSDRIHSAVQFYADVKATNVLIGLLQQGDVATSHVLALGENAFTAEDIPGLLESALTYSNVGQGATSGGEEISARRTTIARISLLAGVIAGFDDRRNISSLSKLEIARWWAKIIEEKIEGESGNSGLERILPAIEKIVKDIEAEVDMKAGHDIETGTDPANK